MNASRTSNTPKRISGWLREPLVHFLVIGALLFLAYHYWGGGGPDSNRIVITPGQIDAMAMRFTRTWQRPPNDEELKGLIDDHVRGEIAAREAMAMGLDKDDMIIRRRLRQKIEFLAEGAADAAPATEAELQSWFDQHADNYRFEPEIGFFQVYLNPAARGTAIDSDAQAMLEQLRAAGSPADSSAGDSLMLPYQMERSRLSSVSRMFGSRFSSQIVTLEPGRWEGPIPSGYGLHLVYVTEREEGRLPDFAEIRPVVERDFTAARRKEALNVMYQTMLKRYEVMIEPGAEQSAAEGSNVAAATGPDKRDPQ